MSVIATSTVSIVPASTRARSSSSVSMPRLRAISRPKGLMRILCGSFLPGDAGRVNRSKGIFLNH